MRPQLRLCGAVLARAPARDLRLIYPERPPQQDARELGASAGHGNSQARAPEANPNQECVMSTGNKTRQEAFKSFDWMAVMFVLLSILLTIVLASWALDSAASLTLVPSPVLAP
jgi:hypothetical protein